VIIVRFTCPCSLSQLIILKVKLEVFMLLSHLNKCIFIGAILLRHNITILTRETVSGPSLCSSGRSSWLLTQRSRVRFPALGDFLSSSGSITGSTQPWSTQPCEDK
jgi:hypothetical protein